MTKKEQIVWRLKEQPTTESLRDLVKDGLLTKDEAREILMTHTEVRAEKDEDALKSEIKFLRELIDKLAGVREVVQTIREIEQPWRGKFWYQPYYTWTTNADNALSSGTSISNLTLTSLN